MLVYKATKKEFIDDVRDDKIDQKILAEFKRKLFKSVGTSEINSWRNSMNYMLKVLIEDGIPNDAGVSIEYTIPLTSKRVDFILTGKNKLKRDTAVIIELKQWSNVKKTNKDAIVETFIGKSEREANHPSYQAWTYAALIEDYNETVRNEKIILLPCAYLHNMKEAKVINDIFYKDHTSKAPIFISEDTLKLSLFLKEHIHYGDQDDIMYRIENGKIRPSKKLADNLVSMISGNSQFIMIDEQKIAYEMAIDLAHKAMPDKKQVLIIEGGPGTGKSVLAINLLVALTKRNLVVQYVSKNAAPRAVFEAKLVGSFRKSHISNLFKGSGSYTETVPNTFDVLLVDEAHRLNEKSGLFQNLGENQIKEIIIASKLSVFFIDENQQVTVKDIGNKNEIKKWATQVGADVISLELESQFRCNGEDGYLAWLDNALGVRETANINLANIAYDFKVFDNPCDLRNEIIQLNKKHNSARMVAGYCWKWVSSKEPHLFDIELPEFNFSAKWNLKQDGSCWIINPNSVNEVGCIHTCQGLELDYIGVIIGPDFIIRDGKAITDFKQRATSDKAVQGLKNLHKSNKEEAQQLADKIIKNTYRTLMSRGQKGCFLYCTDPETNQYFKNAMGREQINYQNSDIETKPQNLLPFEVLEESKVKPFVNAVPVFDVKAAAGNFSGFQTTSDFNWVKLPDDFTIKEGWFIVQVIGESMNKRIPNNSWCVFKANPGGTRQGKIVLVEHRNLSDPDYGGHYTVKRYSSTKQSTENDSWVHQTITLSPESTDSNYKSIQLSLDNKGEFTVIGEFVAVIE